MLRCKAASTPGFCAINSALIPTTEINLLGSNVTVEKEPLSDTSDEPSKFSPINDALTDDTIGNFLSAVKPE